MRRALVMAALALIGPAALLRAGGLFENAEQSLKDQGFYQGPIDGRKTDELTAAIRRYQIRNGLKVSGELDVDTQRALGLTGAPAPRPAATPTPAPAAISKFTPPPGGYRDATTVGPTPSPTSAPTTTISPNDDSADEEEAPAPAERVDSSSVSAFGGTSYDDAAPAMQQRLIAGAQYELLRAGFYHGGVDGIYGPATAAALRDYQVRMRLAPTGQLDRPTLRALGLLRSGWRRAPRRPAPRVYRGEWIPE